jgi:hypothetical protein
MALPVQAKKQRHQKNTFLSAAAMDSPAVYTVLPLLVKKQRLFFAPYHFLRQKSNQRVVVF